MGTDTKIEWATHTFNPWTGCQRVSPGCDHCYAEAQAKRNTSTFGGWGAHAERKRTSETYWRQPLKWNSEARKAGVRPRVFCASMADVFDNKAPEAWRHDLWSLIHATPHLDWLLLTKRPQNIAKMLPDENTHPLPVWGAVWPNVWLGTTVENQAEADRRIPHLLAVPAAKRFLSCEPLLGPVNLESWLAPEKACQSCDDGEGYGNRCSRKDIPREEQCSWNRAVQHVVEHGPFAEDGEPASISCHVVTIDWVICGGESGPGARPMNPKWARSLRDQCADAGVPFFFKQWGEHVPCVCDDIGDRLACFADGAESPAFTDETSHPVVSAHGREYWRIGKKAAGRLLDGVQHDGRPA
jgi:protein gp37